MPLGFGGGPGRSRQIVSDIYDAVGVAMLEAGFALPPRPKRIYARHVWRMLPEKQDDALHDALVDALTNYRRRVAAAVIDREDIPDVPPIIAMLKRYETLEKLRRAQALVSHPAGDVPPMPPIDPWTAKYAIRPFSLHDPPAATNTPTVQA
jgi:hypothetical protein